MFVQLEELDTLVLGHHFYGHVFRACGDILAIHFDARHGRRETEFGAIAIAVRIRVRLDGVQIGRCENSLVVERMVQHEFADATCVRIVVVDPIPYANVAVRTSGYNISAANEQPKWKCFYWFCLSLSFRLRYLLAVLGVATVRMSICVRVTQNRSFEWHFTSRVIRKIQL